MKLLPDWRYNGMRQRDKFLLGYLDFWIFFLFISLLGTGGHDRASMTMTPFILVLFLLTPMPSYVANHEASAMSCFD